MIILFCHKTDGRTDGWNCESNTVHCITCSCTVKTDQMLSVLTRVTETCNR